MQSQNKQSIDIATKLQHYENNINQIELDETQTKALEDLRKIEDQIIQLAKRQEEFENYGKVKPLKQSNQQLSQQIKQLELRMIEMDNQLLNTKTQSRRPEILNLENNFKKNMLYIKQEVQQEYKNIYKEMNGLKCDLDYVLNSSVKLKITNKIKTQNINLESNKILFINLLELETFIEELDHYENNNTQRLLEELKSCDQDKLKVLNFQLAGTKRRYLNEIKKIEYKFQILKELMQPNSPQEKYTIQLNQQMNVIVQRLHKNVDMLLLKISEQQQ